MNSGPLACQADMLPIELSRPAIKIGYKNTELYDLINNYLSEKVFNFSKIVQVQHAELHHTIVNMKLHHKSVYNNQGMVIIYQL